MPKFGQVITNTFRATRGTRSYAANGQLIYTPMKGFWKDATCEEVACTHYLHGWSLPLDFSPTQKSQDLLDAQGAHRYIEDSGRKYTNRWEGSKCIYQFEPGQRCFRQDEKHSRHQVPVERDPVFLHISGPDRFRQLDYDEYHTTFNEHAYKSNQNQHIRN